MPTYGEGRDYFMPTLYFIWWEGEAEGAGSSCAVSSEVCRPELLREAGQKGYEIHYSRGSEIQ